MSVAQAAVRSGHEGVAVEDQMTLSELRGALIALREIEAAAPAAPADAPRQGPVDPAQPPRPVDLGRPAE